MPNFKTCCFRRNCKRCVMHWMRSVNWHIQILFIDLSQPTMSVRIVLVVSEPNTQLNTEFFNHFHTIMIMNQWLWCVAVTQSLTFKFYTRSINSATLKSVLSCPYCLLPRLHVVVRRNVLLVMGIDKISSITMPFSILPIGPIHLEFPYWLFINFLCGKTGVCTGFWHQYNCFIASECKHRVENWHHTIVSLSLSVNSESKQRRTEVAQVSKTPLLKI